MFLAASFLVTFAHFIVRSPPHLISSPFSNPGDGCSPVAGKENPHLTFRVINCQKSPAGRNVHWTWKFPQAISSRWRLLIKLHTIATNVRHLALAAASAYLGLCQERAGSISLYANSLLPILSCVEKGA